MRREDCGREGREREERKFRRSVKTTKEEDVALL